MAAPRYQEVKAGEIPELKDDDGTHVRVVCGDFWGMKGPVDGIAADPIYLDVSVPPGRRKTLPLRPPATHSPTFLEAPESSATHPALFPYRPKGSDGRTRRPRSGG